MDNLPFLNFPAQEIDTFNALCADCNLAADSFAIRAVYPDIVSSGIAKGARIIHVNYEPTGRQQQYHVTPKQPDWLLMFGKELRSGYYTGAPIEA